MGLQTFQNGICVLMVFVFCFIKIVKILLFLVIAWMRVQLPAIREIQRVIKDSEKGCVTFTLMAAYNPTFQRLELNLQTRRGQSLCEG